jgi:hypothetical protein
MVDASEAREQTCAAAYRARGIYKSVRVYPRNVRAGGCEASVFVVVVEARKPAPEVAS